MKQNVDIYKESITWYLKTDYAMSSAVCYNMFC